MRKYVFEGSIMIRLLIGGNEEIFFIAQRFKTTVMPEGGLFVENRLVKHVSILKNKIVGKQNAQVYR